MENLLTFRPAGHAEWQSDDWRWTITSRPMNYPDDGPRTYSVRDNTVEEWVEQDFPTYDAAVAHCESAHRDDLRALGIHHD